MDRSKIVLIRILNCAQEYLSFLIFSSHQLISSLRHSLLSINTVHFLAPLTQSLNDLLHKIPKVDKRMH